ncbi:MAG: hypothetical protein CMJ48_11540 [Planctomycetaceae bacterium]|nr:hypothetical protein [Planctomycetaceae bacterium]
MPKTPMPALALILTTTFSVHLRADDHPLPSDKRKELIAKYSAEVDRLSASLKKTPESLRLYSQRGDALFFLGRFKEAVADYEKMVELNPKAEKSHWRRGIAYFYAGRYKDAAHQFEIYDSFDHVDRENGIWRYFSQYKAYGPKRAKQGLLKYEKDDREPFPSVYKLFSGELSPEAVLAKINSADVDDREREKRYFYAQLYIGLNHAVEGDLPKARNHLHKATANKWGPVGGYGPIYMWHVGRLHYDLFKPAAPAK